MNNFEFLGPHLPKNGFWGRNFKNISLDSELASLRYPVRQFSDKTDNFKFLAPNLPKNGFWGRSFKNLSLDLEPASLRYHVHQFSEKTNNFEFLSPNLPKNKFWSWNFKKSRFRINTYDIQYVPIFSQNGRILIFRPKFGEIAQLRAIFWLKYC